MAIFALHCSRSVSRVLCLHSLRYTIFNTVSTCQHLVLVTMDEYLRTVKATLSGAVAKKQPIHVILGNEACDLDSAVCAVTYAYYLHQTSNKLTVPMLNIPQEDYSLRTESTYFLGKCGITQDLLHFRDTLDLHALHAASLLSLTLVDFNVLRGKDAGLVESVCEILDHHQRECIEKANVEVEIELVGSCCTLVADRLMSDAKFEFVKFMPILLYGTILLDTVCLSKEAARATQHDHDVIDKLEKILDEPVNKQSLFCELQAAKADISSLSSQDILRKDMKQVSGGSTHIAICSLPIDIVSFIAREDAGESLASLSSTIRVDLIVLMSLTMNKDSPYRQIAVYSKQQSTVEKMCRKLEECEEPGLKLVAMASCLGDVTVYRQANVTASRKKILPYVLTVLPSF